VRLVEAIAHATPGRSASETAHRPTGEAAGRPSTALVVGLDVFERVRVGAGQLAAAQAVRAAADAVRATLRDGDTVEPLGEDELAVWLDAAGGDELTAFCDRLARTLAAVPLPARQAPIAARIAIASSPDLPVDLAAHARIARAGSASDTRAAK
jgi:GGDEF domain-containing protein